MATEMIRADGELTSLPVAMPLITVQQMIARHNAITQLTRDVLRDGHDFGIIPGTTQEGKDAKKTLLKPGAEKLCTLFGLIPDFQEDKSLLDFERGIFFFSYRCVLLRGASLEMIAGRPALVGTVVATGIGSANSREKKYRRPTRCCPHCGQPTIFRSKKPPENDPDAEPGWFCWSKKGGCGAQFRADEKTILDQVGAVNPDDAADMINTLQKMAQKRSLIGATLIATNASEFFTQDLEDLVGEDTPKQQSGAGKPRQDQPAIEYVTAEEFAELRDLIGRKPGATDWSKALRSVLFANGARVSMDRARRLWLPLLRAMIAKLDGPAVIASWRDRYAPGKTFDTMSNREMADVFDRWQRDQADAEQAAPEPRQREPGDDDE